ncbi:MAG: type III secretion system export apparatus subunit SctV [Desulfovibrionaceae bacterium]|nr:type III secretion system export apparatus subunit SctV [Desulfovibrionaceae bacterium]
MADLGRIQDLIQRGTRYNDIILAGLLVAIIALMILPLPTVLVDGLIATNLSIAVILMMLSMYIASALELSVFPTLLLFTTLFRLSLNITTTRLILLKANAGAIIYTFGNFVVAGNLVVGGVIFLILTIVQFMVIAKGSERVAEVGARFTLDAMPGKQMSIDADLRAGVIDMDQAKERRERVQMESQLYGAMDGAMKFVKGDAVAGLIITAVNVLGGVAIGTLQRGMPVADALQKYAILTIGDGLVSQIPALLISITAGIVVTRVSGENAPNLGSEIGQQILAQPKALAIAGVLLFLFALIPGFPKPQFLMLATVVGGVGYVLFRLSKRPQRAEADDAPAMAPAGQKATPKKRKEGDEFSITVPLLIDVAQDVQKAIRYDELNDELIKVRRALYLDLGVPFPGIHLRFNESVSGGQYVILLQEIPMSQGRILPGKLIVRDKPANLDVLGVRYETGEDFLPKIPTIWVDESYRDQLKRASVPFMESAQILTYHLSFVLKKHADTFIGLQETRYLLDQMEAGYPELVKEVQRVMPLQKIAEVLQRMVQEEISIRDLRNIMETLIDWGQKEKDPVLLTEYVRISLKRSISYRYSGGQNILAVYLLEPDAEETVRKAIRQTSSGSYLALDPNTSHKFVKAVKEELGDTRDQSRLPALLTSMDIRRYVKKLIELEIPEMPVLSYQELTPEITVQPLGRIRLE